MKKIVFIFLLFFVNISFCQYKVAENYLVQRIVHTRAPYNAFVGIYRTDSYGEYYISSEKDVISFIESDSVDRSKLVLTLSLGGNYTLSLRGNYTLKDSSININYRCYKYFKTIYEYIILDDTEVYKIGGELYAIRKIKYAYLDNVDMYAQKKDYYFYLYGDDQPSEDDDTVLVSAKTFFKTDYIHCLLFVMELKPTHKKIASHLWRRRYEFLNDCFGI
ncbi:MAG: hypothetical protein H6Q15_523 [Bacteroidetes bacterium]|nr:hypothetical protein [Bacteroidota bacterium]